MAKKIAINGFGRIGRLFFRYTFEKSNFDIVAVNDLGDIDNLAYLLQFDTVYGRFKEKVSVEGNNLVVGGKKVQMFQVKDPSSLPWKSLGIDIVVESTGVFESFEQAKAHVAAGAKHVVISAPAKDEDGKDGKTMLPGINEEDAAGYPITSNGSCTTNAAAPVMQVLSENPGIEKALLDTVHAYTATQSIVDSPTKGKDFRRGRAAAQNIIPSSTGAAIAVTRVIPSLRDKFDGIALRIPVVTGSIADITFLAKRKTSVEEISSILSKAADSPRWKGILKVTKDPIVSSDIVGEPYGAIVDLECTRVVDGDLVKVLSWYDNEAGYAATLALHVERVAKKL